LKVEDWRERLTTLEAKDDESLQAFEARCRITVTGAFPDLNADAIESIQVDYFLRGLPTDIRNTVRILQPKTMIEAMEKARFQTYLVNEGKPKKRKVETLNVVNDVNEEPKNKKNNNVISKLPNDKVISLDETSTTKALLALVDVVKQNNYNKNYNNKNYNNNKDHFKSNHKNTNQRYNGGSYNNMSRNNKSGNIEFSDKQGKWPSNKGNHPHRVNNYQYRSKRACFKCGSTEHLIAKCPHQDNRYKTINTSACHDLNSK
jgi:hypothetical protein